MIAPASYKIKSYTHEYRLTGLIECEQCGVRLIGKSGTGKNGKYFYYGHKRKLVTIDNRHLHRCKIETIPALQVEEAIIGRLKDLSTDRKLIAELAKTTAATTQASNDHKRSLLAAKEQERRKLDQRVKNIYEAIADETDKAIRMGLSQKAKEISDQLFQAESSLVDLKQDFDQTSNVVDISSVWEYIRIFRENAFDAQSLAAQSEILKNRIRKIVVRADGIYVEIYGREPQKILNLTTGGQKEKNLTQSPDGSRSGVRPVFKLVEAPGIEPGSARVPRKGATYLAFVFS